MKKLVPILQSTPPNDRNVLWADNSGDNIVIKVWDNGKWKETYSIPSPKVTTKIKKGKFLEEQFIGDFSYREVGFDCLVGGDIVESNLSRDAAKVSDTCNVSLYYNDGNSTSIYEGDAIIQEYTKDNLQLRFLSPKILTEEEVESYLFSGEPVETELLFMYVYDNDNNLLFVNNSLLSGSENIEIGFKAKVKDSIITVTTDYETPMLVTLTDESSDLSKIESDTPMTEISEAVSKGIPVIGKLMYPSDTGIVTMYGMFSDTQISSGEEFFSSIALSIESSFGTFRIIGDKQNDKWSGFMERRWSQPLYLFPTGVSKRYYAFETNNPGETDTPHSFIDNFSFIEYYLTYNGKNIKFYNSGDGRVSFSGIVHETSGNVYIRTFKLVEAEDPSSPDYGITLECCDFLIGNTDELH